MTGVHHGTGQHAWVIPADELPLGLKVWLLFCYSQDIIVSLEGCVC